MKATSMGAVIVTPRGLERLEQELEQLRMDKRREIARRLHDVIEDGEIDENAAYEALKIEQGFIEGRIAELEGLLARARIVQPCEDPAMVSIGSLVEVQAPDGVVEQFMIVGVSEADPRNGCISYASPLGKALLNRVCGEEISFSTPDGLKHYRILSVLPMGMEQTPKES
jgi:transcription elongation factor GreA